MKEVDITREMIEDVARRVGLPIDLYDQDWFVRMVNANDAARLINHYDSFTKPEDKSVLMWFIIKAYDYYLRNCVHEGQIPDLNLEKKLVKQLQENWAEHEDAVEYWSFFDHGDNEPVDEADAFEVTPLMRKLWKEHKRTAN